VSEEEEESGEEELGLEESGLEVAEVVSPHSNWSLTTTNPPSPPGLVERRQEILVLRREKELRYSTVQYSRLLYCTDCNVHYCIVLYYNELYSTVLYNRVLY
jgi:hypothetical protein